MNSRISDARWLPPLRLAVFLGLAAVFATGTFAAPAYADIHPNGKGNDAPRAPARQQVADRDHGWGGHRHYEQRGGRDYYYSAPPVVYAPQGYYVQPGPSLYFSFPLPR